MRITWRPRGLASRSIRRGTECPRQPGQRLSVDHAGPDLGQLALGAVGIPLFVRKERCLGWPLAAAFLLQLYLNSVVDDWWAGTGFGARRFDNCLPLFGLGLAAVYDALRALRRGWCAWVLAAGLVGWNALFLCQYAANWVSHSGHVDMAAAARGQAKMAVRIARGLLRRPGR